MNPLLDFERRIEELIHSDPLIFPPLLCSQIGNQAVSSLQHQATEHAINRAKEVFGASLAILTAAKVPKGLVPEELEKLDFTAIAGHWCHAENLRRKAMSTQLEEITRLLPSKSIESVEILDGDSHNQGFQPLLITANTQGRNERFVYKSIDPIVYKIVEVTSKFVCHGIHCAPLMEEVFAETTHAYLRRFSDAFIRLTPSEIDAYFYNYGVMVALASFLELNDLHFENIITTKSGPKIIDAEFILSATQSRGGKWSYKNCGLFENITSPLSQIDLLSFISSNFECSDNGPRYGFSKKEVREQHLIQDSAGNSVDPRKYVRRLTQGALDADAFIRSHTVELYSLIDELNRPAHRIRCWLRGTAYYRILQLQLWMPKPARLENRISALQKKLASRKTIHQNFPRKILERIIKAEISDLLNMDIPYFWIDGSSGSLHHSTGVIMENYARPTMIACKIRAQMTPLRSPRRAFEKLAI